jgi:hypothetical protein
MSLGASSSRGPSPEGFDDLSHSRGESIIQDRPIESRVPAHTGVPPKGFSLLLEQSVTESTGYNVLKVMAECEEDGFRVVDKYRHEDVAYLLVYPPSQSERMSQYTIPTCYVRTSRFRYESEPSETAQGQLPRARIVPETLRDRQIVPLAYAPSLMGISSMTEDNVFVCIKAGERDERTWISHQVFKRKAMEWISQCASQASLDAFLPMPKVDAQRDYVRRAIYMGINHPLTKTCACFRVPVIHTRSNKMRCPTGACSYSEPVPFDSSSEADQEENIRLGGGRTVVHDE